MHLKSFQPARLLAIFILALHTISTTAQPLTRHVVLISIDGFRPEMFQDTTWPSPNLQWLARHGTWADHLLSVFPSYTYPSHTAMLTGAYPARSKILYNQPKGSRGEWNWFLDSVKVPTLWDACRANHLSTAALQWPVTVGHRIDYNVPEIWAVSNSADRISEARKYATPTGIVDEMERTIGRLDSTTMHEDQFCWDENTARMAAYVLNRYHPNFLAVHFATVDGMEHEYGRDHDSVRLALASNDYSIGIVLAAIRQAGLQDSTTVIVVGDHGFATIHDVMRPNLLIKDIPARFTAAGGSAFLYLQRIAAAYPDLAKAKADIIRQVKDRLARLPADKRALFRILDRPELDQLGADSAALLALAADPKAGLVFSGATSGAATTNHGPGTTIQQNPLEGVFVPTTGGHHGYDPREPQMYTGFIACGPGIHSGGHSTELREVDIAPLIARLLGIPFPTPDGHLPPGVLASGERAASH